MKTYLVCVCESRDSLAFEKVNQLLLKNKAVRISEFLYILQSKNDKLRIDEVCFAISQEGQSDVFVVEADRNSIMSWNFKDKKVANTIVGCLE